MLFSFAQKDRRASRETLSLEVVSALWSTRP